MIPRIGAVCVDDKHDGRTNNINTYRTLWKIAFVPINLRSLDPSIQLPEAGRRIRIVEDSIIQ